MCSTRSAVAGASDLASPRVAAYAWRGNTSAEPAYRDTFGSFGSGSEEPIGRLSLEQSSNRRSQRCPK